MCKFEFPEITERVMGVVEMNGRGWYWTHLTSLETQRLRVTGDICLLGVSCFSSDPEACGED